MWKNFKPVNEAKTAVVRRSADGTMVGLIMTAISRRGPSPSPVRKAKPSNIPSRLARFFPVSGVLYSPRNIVLQC